MSYANRLEDEDRQLIAASMERLAQDHFSLERCRQDEIVCDDVMWSSFAEQGVFGLGINPDYGGLGGGISEIAIMMRLIGEMLLPLPYLDNLVLCARLIDALGTSEQKHSLLGQIATGELRLAFAHREVNSGNQRDHVECRAVSGRITGQKIEVMDGVHASRFLVSARDEEGLLRFLLVDRDATGLEVHHYRLLDNRLVSRLVMTDVAGEALGLDASDALDAVCDIAAACKAVETLGAMTAANRETLNYAKVRTQFGRTIGSFQVLQHRLVDMFIAEQTVAALVADAISASDGPGHRATAAISAAKAQADRLARQVGEASIQIHGGMGMTDECAVGHYLKRIIVNGSQFGTASWHVSRLCKPSG